MHPACTPPIEVIRRVSAYHRVKAVSILRWEDDELEPVLSMQLSRRRTRPPNERDAMHSMDHMPCSIYWEHWVHSIVSDRIWCVHHQQLVPTETVLPLTASRLKRAKFTELEAIEIWEWEAWNYAPEVKYTWWAEAQKRRLQTTGSSLCRYLGFLWTKVSKLRLDWHRRVCESSSLTD